VVDRSSADLRGADRARVFVARQIPDEALDLVRASCELDLWDGDLPPPRDALLRRVAGVDGALTLLTDKVDDAFLDAAGPQLRVVSNYAVGFDNIDVAACARRGVKVGNTPGVLTETTADLAWALLMASARRLPEGDRFVRDGKWKTWGPLLLLGPDVHGSTIGIVGVPHGEVPFNPTFFRNVGWAGGPAPSRLYIPDLLPDVLDGRINPGLVLDYETDLDGISDAYEAMDERRAIKSLVRIGSV